MNESQATYERPRERVQFAGAEFGGQCAQSGDDTWFQDSPDVIMQRSGELSVKLASQRLGIAAIVRVEREGVQGGSASGKGTLLICIVGESFCGPFLLHEVLDLGHVVV